MREYETEIVRIEWNIENPEAAITKLITRLGDIDAKLGEVAQKAAQFGANIALSLNAAGASADALVGKMERALAGMEAVAARSGSTQPRDPLTGQMMNWGAFQQQYGSPLASQAQAQAQAIENLVRSGMSRADAEAGVRAATRGAGYAPFQAQARLYDPVGMIGASAVGAFLGTSGVDYSAASRLGGPTIPPSQALVPYGPSIQNYLRSVEIQRAQAAQLASLYNQEGLQGPQLGGQVIPPGMALVPVSGSMGGWFPGGGGFGGFRGPNQPVWPGTSWQGSWPQGTIPLGPSGFLGGPGGGGGGGPFGGFPGFTGPTSPTQFSAYGPYSEQEYWQRQQGWFSQKAQMQWGLGNIPGFEQTMQQQWYPAFQEQRRAQAGVGVFQTAQDEAAMAGLAGGGRPSQRAFLDVQAQSLRSQQEAARLVGNAQEYDRLSKSLDENRKKYGELGSGVDEFDDRFGRHLRRVAESIIIWTVFRTALRAVEDVIKGVAEETLRLESIQARVSFIEPGAPGVLGQNVQAAGYGITPTQAGGGALAAAQLGLSVADQQRAAQLTLIFGADQYENIVRELYQTQIRANAVGVESVNIMDYMATAYQTAGGGVEVYGDALQSALSVFTDLGLGVEQTALALLKISEATEKPPEQIATTIQSVITKLGKPETQELLGKRYGIEPGKPEEMILQISAALDRLVSSGNAEKAQRLLEAIGGGQIQGPQRIIQLQTIFHTLVGEYAAGNVALTDHNKLIDELGKTGTVAFSRLNASFRVWLSSLLEAPPLIDAINASAKNFQESSLLRTYIQEMGLTAPGHPAGLQAILDSPEFQAWMNERNDPASRERSWAADAARWQAQANFYNPPLGKGQLAFPEPPAFGGFQTFPKGQDWDQFKALVRDYETKLKDVPGYTVDRQQIAFLDEQTKQFRYLLADTNAIRFATEESRKMAAEQITGVFNIPDSGRALVAFYALQQGYVPRDRADALASGAGSFPKAKEISDPITTAVYTVNDTLLTFGDIFGAARGAYGGGKQPGGIPKVTDGVDVYSQYLPVIEEGASKGRQEMQRRQNFTRRMLPEDALFSKIQREQDELIAAEGLGGSRSDTPMRSRRSTAQRAQQMSIPITINSRIVINVDGRRIQQMINRQTYQQFSQIAGGAGVAAGSSVL